MESDSAIETDEMRIRDAEGAFAIQLLATCDGVVASDEKVSSAMASEQAHKKRTRRRMDLTRYRRQFAIKGEHLFV